MAEEKISSSFHVKHTAAFTGDCPICHTFVPTAVHLFHFTISRYQSIPIAYILNTFYHRLEIIISYWYNLVFTWPTIVTEQNFAIHNYYIWQLKLLKFRRFFRTIAVTDSLSEHSLCCKIHSHSYSAGRFQWPRDLMFDLLPLVCWNCRFEFRRGRWCLSLVNVVCCQVETSATGWSPVQRSPTACGFSNWVWSWSLDNEEVLAYEGTLRYGKGTLQNW